MYNKYYISFINLTKNLIFIHYIYTHFYLSLLLIQLNNDDDDLFDSLSLDPDDFNILARTFDGSLSKQCLHTGFESKS